jgi:hypothetical protein
MIKTEGILMNDLELGFAPMSAYHFGQLIKDSKFHNNVFDSHIYIIAQRKQITFNNLVFWKNLELSFDIIQEGNSEIVRCTLPILQKNITTDLSKTIEIRLHNRKNKIEKKVDYPFNGTQGFTIQQTDYYNKKVNVGWFSPDKLFQNYWKGHINAKFTGEYSSMLEYKVHYVGKSTEQNICKRLSNHSTFQEILTNQEPFSFGEIPSNEIMILLFRVKDNNTIVKWGDDVNSNEISKYITDYTLPSDKTISLDAEKALIKHLQPEYNRILYNSFPKKNDLVNNDFHNLILYALSDPITLAYNEGIIKGSENFSGRDYISVKKKK